MINIHDILTIAPVIPVLVLDGSFDPASLAEVLVSAGLPIMEVTLRTPFALEAIRSMSKVPGAIVGAGTVLNPTMLDDALQAGARFLVSPGLTESLAGAAIASRAPFLPGVANAGDIMRGLDLGFGRFKFFPAEAAGGLPALNALAGPFGNVRFCPTGGISEANAPVWLSHPSVDCVGGSWIAPPGDDDLPSIASRAQRASALSRAER